MTLVLALVRGYLHKITGCVPRIMLGGAGSTPSAPRLGPVLVVDRIDTLSPGVDPEQWRRNALLAELVDATDLGSVTRHRCPGSTPGWGTNPPTTN